MWDFHNGFGSMLQGHAHPVIGEAVLERYGKGTHFAAPTEDALAVAENLSSRWGLPKWRYTNSGSESTMDAIRIARAYTGRDTVMKIFGSYHGHHDTVMVSIGVEYDKIGDRDNLASLPYGGGIPDATVQMTVPVPFNDAEAMERRIIRLTDEGRKPACIIMEPAMMNLGLDLIEDQDDAVSPGDLTDLLQISRFRQHDAQVHHGRFHDDAGGLAKALGAGLPSGAIGGTEEVMSVVEDHTVFQVGTYNGNPPATAAAIRVGHRQRPLLLASRSHEDPPVHVEQPRKLGQLRVLVLEKVLNPEAYAHLDHLNDRILAGCTEVIERYNLPGYAVGVGGKGCVTFSLNDLRATRENALIEVVEVGVCLRVEDLLEVGPHGGHHQGVAVVPTSITSMSAFSRAAQRSSSATTFRATRSALVERGVSPSPPRRSSTTSPSRSTLNSQASSDSSAFWCSLKDS